jgi:hypothetical protein
MSDSPKKSSPAPNVPEIEKCPRCGADVLIGDRRCSNCGYDLTTVDDWLRSLNPTLVAFVGLVVGIAFVLAATGMDGILQIFFVLLGSAIVLGGGVFMGLSIILADRRRLRK